MQLATALIVAVMILVSFGVTDMPLRCLNIQKRSILFLLFMLLVLHAYPIRVIPELTVNPAAILLLLCMGIFALKRRGGFIRGILLAIPAGAMVYLLARMIEGREPGLFYGLASGAVSALLILRPRGAFFTAAFAPFVTQGLMAAEELVEFGTTRVEAGGGIFYDTMITGMVFSFLLYCLRFIKFKKTVPTRS